MAWERRQRGGLYFTRSVRRGGRVLRRYYGCGVLAQSLAKLDAMDREERAEERQRLQHEREPHTRARDVLRALSADLDGLAAQALEAAGFHKHRGQWRRRRAV